MKTNKQISTNQLLFLVLQSQIGIGVLSLAHDLYLNAFTDGWISIINAGIVNLLFLFIILTLNKQYPQDTLYDFSQKITGMFFGKLFSCLYVLYFISVNILVIHLSTGVLKKWLLPLTPEWILFLVFISVAVYLVKENLRIIARVYVIVSLLVIVLIALILSAYMEVNVKYIFPVGQSGIKNIMLASHEAIVAMLGFELLLIVYPFVQASHKQKVKYSALAVIAVTTLYTFFVFSSYIYFSPDQLAVIPEPLLYMLKAVDYELIERLDLIFLVIWIVPMTTSIGIYIYLSSIGLSKLFRQQDHQKSSFIVGGFVFLFTLIIPSTPEFTKQFGEIISTLSYIFVGGIPLFLLSIVFFKQKIGKRESV
ncbi:spore germination protein [Bacillus shivajii]|uniref:GerAB/ArcD/ProY family transporter n=1 Tax=Bacillus shivajii TaxID=1983719 RepID=UPI001CFA62BD|nr:GerAB/ArcD/ProY family transporter [Bacillus shivajii]UCZ53762.1 spore germination protein [Bacillus shivajii]